VHTPESQRALQSVANNSQRLEKAIAHPDSLAGSGIVLMFFDDVEDLLRRDVAFQLSQLRLARGLQVEVFGNGFDERDQLGHFMFRQQTHRQVEIGPARRLSAHPVLRDEDERGEKNRFRSRSTAPAIQSPSVFLSVLLRSSAVACAVGVKKNAPCAAVAFFCPTMSIDAESE
jgi:hypothetical protein